MFVNLISFAMSVILIHPVCYNAIYAFWILLAKFNYCNFDLLWKCWGFCRTSNATMWRFLFEFCRALRIQILRSIYPSRLTPISPIWYNRLGVKNFSKYCWIIGLQALVVTWGTSELNHLIQNMLDHKHIPWRSFLCRAEDLDIFFDLRLSLWANFHFRE